MIRYCKCKEGHDGCLWQKLEALKAAREALAAVRQEDTHEGREQLREALRAAVPPAPS